MSLVGLRFSRVNSEAAELSPNQQFSAIKKKTFVSLDRLELIDLLRPVESPFRLIISSSQTETSNKNLFSFCSQTQLNSMSWESHKMMPASDWGFHVSPSMEKRHDAINQLTPLGFSCITFNGEAP